TRSPQAASRGSDKVWVDRWISRRAFGLPSAFVGNVAGRADPGYPVGHRASTRRRTSTSPSPPHRPHARRAPPLLSAALHRRLHLEELIAEHRGALEVQSRGGFAHLALELGHHFLRTPALPGAVGRPRLGDLRHRPLPRVRHPRRQLDLLDRLLNRTGDDAVLPIVLLLDLPPALRLLDHPLHRSGDGV